jgi:hypothetical protein
VVGGQWLVVRKRGGQGEKETGRLATPKLGSRGRKGAKRNGKLDLNHEEREEHEAADLTK